MDKQADNNAEIIASESNQAILYREQKKYSKAYKCIEKAINLGKNESWIYYYSFWSAGSLGYREKAQEFIEKGLKLYLDDIDLNFSAGLYYESIREYAKALTYLDKLNDDYDDKYTLYLTLGICNEKSGKYDIASDYYQKAKSINDCQEIRKKISTLKKKRIFLFISGRDNFD